MIGPRLLRLSPQRAQVGYRRMLDGIVRYLEEMETPRPLIEAMVSTSSAEIRWFEIETSGAHAPSFAELADASRGQFITEESQKMIQLDVKRARKKLSETDQFLYNLLREKYVRKADCELELIFSHRDRLAPP